MAALVSVYNAATNLNARLNRTRHCLGESVESKKQFEK